MTSISETTEPHQSPVTGLLVALLPASAIGVALGYRGEHPEYFAASLMLLTIWLAVTLLRGYATGFVFPVSPVVTTLLLFCGWLGFSMVWSLAPYASLFRLWEVASVLLVFLIWKLAPTQRGWRTLFFLVQCLGVALALYALYQKFGLQQDPRSFFSTRNSHAAFLNLVALAGMGGCLHSLARGRLAWSASCWHGLALFLLAFAVFLTGSRGATLALLIGSALVLWTNRKAIPTYASLAVLLLLALAYGATELSGAGVVADRLLSLSEPGSAGMSRFIIWEPAWRMFLEAPWLGVGAGIFFLAYPPYREVADTSSGAHVHNDYLELAIETGIPGVTLFLLFLLAVGLLYRRAMRHVEPGHDSRLEMSGLFAGLVATALHSFFTFNFYILPVVILVGLVLARLHQLATGVLPVTNFKLQPARRFTPLGYRLIIFFGMLLPFLYLLGTGLSQHQWDQAQLRLQKGEIQEALQALKGIPFYAPGSVVARNEEARIYTALLHRDPDMPAARRAGFYQEATRLLARAQRDNPLSPQTYFYQGQLAQTVPELAGDRWREQAGDAYAAALRTDPRFYLARMAYAHLLLEQKEEIRALELLKGGSEHPYKPRVPLLGYYQLLVERLRAGGDIKGAERIEARRQEVIAKFVAAGQPKTLAD